MTGETPAPLTGTTSFILFSLSPAPRHGYSIIKEVNRLSDGRIFMSAGTLCGALKRLVDTGWIEPVEKAGREEGNPDRKFYRLTRNGSERLREEIQRIRGLAVLVKEYQSKGGK
jgi:DNA-binding PadR family transcriptional regulator